MLKLTDVVKDYYVTKELTVHALKGINASFSDSGFVAVLGPSGCGKTTLLNIVGGLDRYTTGDLIVDGKSTKDFKDKDWDNYRNKKIGMVFQSYNLIPHMTVEGNVELALTLSGIERTARKAMVDDALKAVGLEGQGGKHPNQLSGGQQQRVAIARAIVNNPSIILADEPTGALDSVTSVQVMDILSRISKNRLIIMVTHNRQLAFDYADRVIEMKDGQILSDISNSKNQQAIKQSSEEATPAKPKETDDYTIMSSDLKDQVKKELKESEPKKEKSSMSFFTAFSISLQNLFSKKGRTVIISLAASIGIIGVGLSLSLSNGFTQTLNNIQEEALAEYPVTVENYWYDTSSFTSMNTPESYPDDHDVIVNRGIEAHINNITDDYAYNYVGNIDKKLLSSDPQIYYALQYKVLTSDKYGTISNVNTYHGSILETITAGGYWNELPSNKDFVLSKYDVIEGKYPENKNEVVLVVNKYNQMANSTLSSLGFDTTQDKISVSDIVATDTNGGKVFKAVANDDYYTESSSTVSVKGTFIRSREQLKADGLSLGSYLTDISSFVSAVSAGTDTSAYQAKLDKYFNSAAETRNLHYFTSPSNNTEMTAAYNKGSSIKVVGILRPKKSSAVSILTPGVYCSSDLVKESEETNKTSLLAKEYENHMVWQSGDLIKYLPSVYSVLGSCERLSTGDPAASMTKYMSDSVSNLNTYINNSKYYGTDYIVSTISIYPKSFAAKEKLLTYLNAYNDGKDSADQIKVTDAAGLLLDVYKNIINISTTVLLFFASISLVVSSIMIGIITYNSVIERTKEIGILRAIGARKIDISRLFKAEASLIGFFSGTVGVLIAYLITFIFNGIFNNLGFDFDLSHIANLSPLHALLLVVISVILTYIASLIPARIASKKDPVVALRTE
jgi:putative ABC transport system permease protein